MRSAGEPGAPGPLLGPRIGGPAADRLFARLDNNAVRRRHRSRLSSRPRRPQTSEVRLQSARRVASHSDCFCPDRRAFFHSCRPGAGKPVHRLRPAPAGLCGAAAGLRRGGGQCAHCEIWRPLARGLGLNQQLSSAQIQKSVGDFVARARNGFSNAFTKLVSGGTARCSISCRS